VNIMFFLANHSDRLECVYHGFEPPSDQTKDYQKLVFAVSPVAALRSKD
jgi:hypothetical protein